MGGVGICILEAGTSKVVPLGLKKKKVNERIGEEEGEKVLNKRDERKFQEESYLHT